jgi:hypothetical protein
VEKWVEAVIWSSESNACLIIGGGRRGVNRPTAACFGRRPRR